MSITTTYGHLTAHDKRVIVAILQSGGTGAKTPRKSFRIEGGDVWITETGRDDYGRQQERTHRASFIASGDVRGGLFA